MRFNILRIFLIVLLFPLHSAAQQFQPSSVNYTVEHGVPSSECYSVIQDRKGRIWVGSDKGICRFDGIRFFKFTTSNSLPDNVVFGLREDHKGRIWCRTIAKGIFYIENDKVVVPSFNKALLAASKSSIVNNFCITKDDSVFMEVNNYTMLGAKIGAPGIHLYHSGNWVIRFINSTGFMYGSLDALKKGVHFIINDTTHFVSPDTLTIYDATFRTCLLRNGDVLFNNHDRLWIKRKGAASIKPFDHFKSRVIAIYEDRDGGVWVGTVNNGLFYYDRSPGKTYQHYFQQESISDIMQDAEGGIWLTTLKSGVHYIINKNVISIGSNQQPFCFSRKAEQDYIACSKNGDVLLVDHEKVLRKIPTPMGTLAYRYIYDIYDYDSNTLLLSGSGSFLMDKHSLKSKSKYRSNYFFRGVRGKAGHPYFYLFGHASIMYLDVKTKKRLGLTPYPGGRIQDITIAEDGNLWLGTLSGLVYCKVSDSSFKNIGEGLLRSRINAIRSVDNKLILVTDGAGILVYDPGKGTFLQVSERDGLSSNTCQNVTIDGNTLWVASNKGISVLRMSGDFEKLLGIFRIDKHDGLPGEEINHIIVDEDRILVASNSGLTWFSKNLQTENLLPPRIWFSQVRTNKNIYNSWGEHVFASDENHIDINFYGISYKSLKDLKYKYRLKGADENWTYTSEPHVAYPALSPGNYIFELYAVNNDGISSLAPIVFSFEVRPPFWLTWPFLFIAIFVIAGVVTGIFYYRMQLVRKREQERNFYNNRILEYEMKALKAQMNPHFIFNAVASIQNFIISSDLKAANRYLVKFSRLIRGVLDNSHSNMIPLAREIDTLRLYIDIENLRFSNKIEYSIVYEEGVDAERFLVPPMLIQPFVENAIWHGLLPKSHDCRLAVRLRVVNNKIECSIDDNGVGRKAAALSPIQLKKKRSLGVEMTQHRIVALEKIYNMDLRIEIIDKIDEQHQPAGTIVMLTLPIIT